MDNDYPKFQSGIFSEIFSAGALTKAYHKLNLIFESHGTDIDYTGYIDAHGIAVRFGRPPSEKVLICDQKIDITLDLVDILHSDIVTYYESGEQLEAIIPSDLRKFDLLADRMADLVSKTLVKTITIPWKFFAMRIIKSTTEDDTITSTLIYGVSDV